jgi:hypothetical protein
MTLPSLEIQSRSGSAVRRRQVYIALAWTIGGFAIATATIAVGIWILISRDRWQKDAFIKKINQAHLVGQSEQQVVSVMGSPISQWGPSSDGIRILTFQGPPDEAWCKVTFDHGVAFQVQEIEK